MKSEKTTEKEEATENEDGSITIKLSKPVTVFGKKKDSITLREPTGKEFTKIGMVISIDTQERIHFDAAKVTKMAETLADLPSGSLDVLPYKQLNKIAYAMLPFFI